MSFFDSLDSSLISSDLKSNGKLVETNKKEEHEEHSYSNNTINFSSPCNENTIEKSENRVYSGLSSFLNNLGSSISNAEDWAVPRRAEISRDDLRLKQKEDDERIGNLAFCYLSDSFSSLNLSRNSLDHLESNSISEASDKGSASETSTGTAALEEEDAIRWDSIFREQLEKRMNEQRIFNEKQWQQPKQQQQQFQHELVNLETKSNSFSLEEPSLVPPIEEFEREHHTYSTDNNDERKEITESLIAQNQQQKSSSNPVQYDILANKSNTDDMSSSGNIISAFSKKLFSLEVDRKVSISVFGLLAFSIVGVFTWRFVRNH
jgi:hypothetical protein